MRTVARSESEEEECEKQRKVVRCFLRVVCVGLQYIGVSSAILDLTLDSAQIREKKN